MARCNRQDLQQVKNVLDKQMQLANLQLKIENKSKKITTLKTKSPEHLNISQASHSP